MTENYLPLTPFLTLRNLTSLTEWTMSERSADMKKSDIG